MRVLYVGKVNFGGTCYSRYRAYVRLGCDVDVINIEDFKKSKSLIIRFLNNKNRYFLKKLNEKISNSSKNNYTIIHFDTPFYIFEQTLELIKNSTSSKIIFHYTDDIEVLKHGLLLNKNSYLLSDYIFTCNVFSIEYFKSIGVNHAFYNEVGYDDENIVINNSKKFNHININFGFIGHYEKSYEKDLDMISNSIFKLKNKNKSLRINLDVHGSGWFRNNFFKSKPYLKKIKKNITGLVSHSMYWSFLSSVDVGIGLFSTMNRNKTTGRTFEIPASNSLLLTRETDIIKTIFNHNETALFWNDKNIDIVIENLIKDRDKSAKICKNGHEFIRDNKFRWMDRVQEIIDIINLK